jgi:hypothetical protein
MKVSSAVAIPADCRYRLAVGKLDFLVCASASHCNSVLWFMMPSKTRARVCSKSFAKIKISFGAYCVHVHGSVRVPFSGLADLLEHEW